MAAQGFFAPPHPGGAGHYSPPPAAGERVNKPRLTQVGRALKQLGIEHIPSYCPEGRGRMERRFGRLPRRPPPPPRPGGGPPVWAAWGRGRGGEEGRCWGGARHLKKKKQTHTHTYGI